MIKGIINSESDLIDAVYEQCGVIIYGLGLIGRCISDNLSEIFYDLKHNRNIIYAVTDEENKKKTIFANESEILTIHEAVKKYPDYPVIIATVDNRNNSMLTNCQNLASDVYTVGIKYYSERSFKERMKSIETRLTGVETNIMRIERKLSMVDNIWMNGNVRFYVPNYPADYIQRTIVDSQDFYEAELLKELDEFIPNNATILDIGANIGNHSLYWSKIRFAHKIFAFEPMISTYQILHKNVQINRLEDKVFTYNIGLSDASGSAELNTHIYSHPEIKFSIETVGSAALSKSAEGEMRLQPLDSLTFINELEQIDFVKIDVEGFECNVLKGAEKTLRKFKPLIFIESFSQNYIETDKILTSFGYEMIKKFDDDNYLYK